MQLDLERPIFIIPEFVKGHQSLAEKMGLKFGPPARIAKDSNGRDIPHLLVGAPKGWCEMCDSTGVGELDGAYLADRQGRRRVMYGYQNSNYPSAQSEVIHRFAVQQWWLGDDNWLWYVRKIIGGEGNVFRHPHRCAHVVFETQIKGFVDDGKDACLNWLEEHYPDWKNPMAYWSKA